MFLIKKPKLVVVLGPTAVGKSSLALSLAKKLDGEIISADSMQVYKGMDIGTAKPSKEERREIRHYLIDVVSPKEEWSVADFAEAANELVPTLYKKGALPIMAGGTGLYINAFLEGFDFPIVQKNAALRDALEKETKKIGSEGLHARLKKIDKKAAERIHPNDLKRIIRALEVYEQTGNPISKLQKKNPAQKKYDIKIIGLNMERSALYKKIEDRVDKMIADGLVEEVKGLLAVGCSKDLPAMQALGYKEAIGFLEGLYGLEEMGSLLKKNTRNFARRQLVWFRRMKGISWFDAEKEKDILAEVLKLLSRH